MSTPSAAQFTGDIPRSYDRYLGPILFEPYATDLARRAAALKPASVLEIAGGTGVSTVALREALPPATRIVATDLNQAMLDIAKGKLEFAANVEFKQADAAALPFENEAFDLVAIQFGVMFFPDRPAAYAEARRVLTRGGTLIFNAWGAMDAVPYAQITNAAAMRFFPNNPPKFYLTPFGYAGVQQVYIDLKAGGFTDISHDVVRVERTVPDWTHFAKGAVYGNPMIADINASKTVKADDVVHAVASELEARFGKAPAQMPLEATIYAARKTT